MMNDDDVVVDDDDVIGNGMNPTNMQAVTSFLTHVLPILRARDDIACQITSESHS